MVPKASAASCPAPWFSITFARDFWITMRPYLTFVSGAAGLVGLSFVENRSALTLMAAFVPLFLSYGFGQALTDCFQTDTDSISSPYRPLVQGRIRRNHVLWTAMTGLILSGLLLALINPWILVAGGLAVVGLLTYTPFKRRWWGGPPWNSWIVALLPIMGWMVGGGRNPTTLFHGEFAHVGAFLPAVGAVFFGYANFVVMGYFKDISADRATGYRTIPVVFAWTAAAICSDLLAVTAAGCTAIVLTQVHGFGVASAVSLLLAAVVNLRAQIGIHRTRDEHNAHGPIASVVRAFVLYSLAITLALRPNWLVLCLIFYATFEWTLRMRPERTQV